MRVLVVELRFDQPLPIVKGFYEGSRLDGVIVG